jgi:hypothetical protein
MLRETKKSKAKWDQALLLNEKISHPGSFPGLLLASIIPTPPIKSCALYHRLEP